MTRPFRKLLVRCMIVIAFVGPLTPLVLADRPPEREILDGRLEGYKDNANVTLDGGGTSLMWFLLVFLGVLGTIGLFKDAKRTHLD